MNETTFECGAKVLPSITEAVQMPTLNIPNNRSVKLYALAGNTGAVYIGPSRPDVENTTNSYPLEPGKDTKLQIRDLSEVWVLPATINNTIAWIVEQ